MNFLIAAAAVWIMIDISPGITTEFKQGSFQTKDNYALVYVKHEIAQGTVYRAYGVDMTTCNSSATILIQGDGESESQVTKHNRHGPHIDDIIANHICIAAGL